MDSDKTKLFKRNIVEIGAEAEPSKNETPCPVCKDTIFKHVSVRKVELEGRQRATWVHDSCSSTLAVSEKVLKDQETAKTTAPAISKSPRSLDGVIAEIAKLEGRKAAYEAVMDIGPAELHIKQANGKAVVKGAKHKFFDRAVKLSVNREPIFLIGPTGSGKSYLARQVAEATLKSDGSQESLPYSEVPCSAGISEGHLMGKLLPTGEQGSFQFHDAALSGAYGAGGFCCLEEIDGADPNTLLCINSALAGEEMALPNNPWDGAIARHQDFVLCIVGNTWGIGADRMYVGRSQLDTAFLDRFAINTLEIDYDKRLEAVLCPDSDLLEKLWAWRQAIVNNKLRRILSTRTIAKWYRYQHDIGISFEEIKETYFGGWSEDERKLVEEMTPYSEDDKKEDD